MKSSHICLLFILALSLVTLFPSVAQQSPSPDFVPDTVFKGSSLAGWNTIGGATWTAEDGVITADASSGAGLLMTDEGYQNVAVFSRFRCNGACDAGILLRAEETVDGMKGLLVALEGEDVVPYRVTLSKKGDILTRTSVQDRRGGGQDQQNTQAGSILQSATAALTAPVRIERGQWNTIEIYADGNRIYNHLNNVRNGIPGGEFEELPPLEPPSFGGAVVPPLVRTFGYGPMALYVGAGRVSFDNVSFKDLHTHIAEPEVVSDKYEVQRLNPFYYGWGADAADINNDGITDLISGPFYYLGPDYLQRFEFYESRVFNPGLEYINDMLTFVDDWNGDGWADIVLTERRPLVMYVNPKGEKRFWDRVEILPDVCSETAVRADIDGDGQPEIAYVNAEGQMAFGEPDPNNLNGQWLTYAISDPIIEGCNSHGVGVGDVNGDGRADILQARGWWEQPAQGAKEGPWIEHAESLGRLTRSPQHPGGAEMSVYDFNGDGLNDVITSLSAHGWGLAWYEQQRDAAGHISFDQHLIMGDFSTKNAGDVTFSQVHSGATLADYDGDGVMDFVTGKRHWSHLDAFTDPDPNGEAVIYWYKTVRNPEAEGGVEFVPELIHNKSGVGSEVKVLDIDEDGVLDIISSGSHGTFIFWGKG